MLRGRCHKRRLFRCLPHKMTQVRGLECKALQEGMTFHGFENCRYPLTELCLQSSMLQLSRLSGSVRSTFAPQLGRSRMCPVLLEQAHLHLPCNLRQPIRQMRSG